MSNRLVKIENLTVSVPEKTILSGLNLEIPVGETHVLMGQNGVGKSTLGAAIMGSPAFSVDSGKIYFGGEDITNATADERAKKGIFLSFQNPEEIDGISLESFLRAAKKAVTGEPIRVLAFRRELMKNLEKLDLGASYAGRDLNVGFSGGEKKKSEILQMLTLNPSFAILDETDSGLDVDAVRFVAKGVREYRNDQNSVLIITHNAALLDGMKIDKVHILSQGKITHSGDARLVDQIINEGFASILHKEVGA